ncbi:hypothetical protein ABB29_06245 [Pseudoxanthomonas dokdonensis]|uniref:DUF1302 domain-containing protein n=2 Tax=Pseudoxanthomonas dokdonensis TaxID=344882 RepID=A0A0R0CX74_9GAMM|nr:hypothetical protein ABB29_06245 [Pseudoxanthomonas dokdonensis]
MTRFHRLALAIALVTTVPAAQAVDFEWGDVQGSLTGSLGVGGIWTTEQASPDLIFRGNALAAGRDGQGYNPFGGRNIDDGRLNYQDAGLASAPIFGLARLDLKQGNFDLRIGIRAWSDQYQKNHRVPFGNLGNGYAGNQPLDDDQFDRQARFDGIALTEAYIHGRFNPGGHALDLTLGNQLLPWGESKFFVNGINTINAYLLQAQRTPGDTLRLPSQMLSASLQLTEKTRLGAFYQYRWDPIVLDGCGTAFSTYDYVAGDCNGALPRGSDDRLAYQQDLLVERAPDVEPRDSGQMGLTLSHEFGTTTVSGYALNLHSNRPYVGIIADRYQGLDDNGLDSGWRPPTDSSHDSDSNVRYVLEYPEDIQLYGISFNAKPGKGLQLFGEYSLRHDQPIQLATADLIYGFAADPAFLGQRIGEPLTLADARASTAPGDVFHGYDRYDVSQFSVGAIQPIPDVMGAKALVLMAELGAKYVHAMAPLSERRYAKVDAYGSDLAAGNSTGCAIGTPAPEFRDRGCSSDGYATPFAWGYRLRAQLTYADVAPGLSLTPYLMFGQDVNGYSYDVNFVEGRLLGTAGIKLDYRQRYFAELYWSGSGNTPYGDVDRDYLSASMGVRF